MKFISALLVFFILACNNEKNKGYKGTLSHPIVQFTQKPQSASNSSLEIDNNSTVELKLPEKTVENSSKSQVKITFSSVKDSSGNYRYHIQYDRINIHTKSGETEQDASSDNGMMSINPVDKILAVLKSSPIDAVISAKGKLISVIGYKEMTDKIRATVSANDEYSKSIIEKRLDQVVNQGMIRKNMSQLFGLFPDSSVHVGDSWTTQSRQTEGVNMTVKTVYTLESVEDDIARLELEGTISSDSSVSNVMGQDVMAAVSGKQQGEYRINLKTGLISKADIATTVEGTIQLLGEEIPIKIESSTKIEGNPVKK